MDDAVAEPMDCSSAFAGVWDAVELCGAGVVRLADSVVENVDAARTDERAEQGCGLVDGVESDHESDVVALSLCSGKGPNVGVNEAAPRSDAITIGENVGDLKEALAGIDAQGTAREATCDGDRGCSLAAGEIEDAEGS